MKARNFNARAGCVWIFSGFLLLRHVCAVNKRIYRFECLKQCLFKFRSSSSHGITKRQTVAVESLIIVGFRIEHADKEPSIENGVPILRAGSTVSLRLFGQGFTEMTHIGLSPEKLDYGGVCNMMIGTGFRVHFTSAENVVVDVLLPMSTVELYFCATNDAVSLSFSLDDAAS